MRGVTFPSTTAFTRHFNISTHTPHARRDYFYTDVEPTYEISTHTPHARRDAIQTVIDCIGVISTHTPHARRDLRWELASFRSMKFQLTRLMRGVTVTDSYFVISGSISTHTPHARRDEVEQAFRQGYIISTHTPHARRDVFKSLNPRQCKISTHTPHARRDSKAWKMQ